MENKKVVKIKKEEKPSRVVGMPEGLVQALLNYLQRCPYGDVAVLIEGIQTSNFINILPPKENESVK